MCAMQSLVYRWASVQRSPAKSGHLGTNRFDAVALGRSTCGVMCGCNGDFKSGTMAGSVLSDFGDVGEC